jgi:hypothetical protein
MDGSEGIYGKGRQFMVRSFPKLRNLVCTLFCVFLFALQGCGNPSVDVQIPKDAKEVATNVVSGSAVVGEVVSTSQTEGAKVLHIEIDSDISDSLLRQGTVAWIEKTDSGEIIDIDATNATEQLLGSGAVLIAKRRNPVDRVEQFTQRWAGNGTLITIGIAVALILIVLFGMRSFMRSIGGLILILFSLGAAAFVSYICNSVASAALVKWVYPHIGDGGTEFAKEMGLPDGVVAGMVDPRVVSFFVVGLFAFVFITSILKRATSSRGKE